MDKIILRTALFIWVVFILAGCAEKYPVQPKSDIKGKFVFYSLRDMKDSGYILQDRKIALLEDNIGCPRWSPDGKFIAYATNDGIVIYNDANKAKERVKTPLRLGQLAWTADGENIVYVTKDGIYKDSYIRLYKYNILTKEHNLIKDFGKGHGILELSISKDGKLLFLDDAADVFNVMSGGIFLMDLNGENLKLVRKSAMGSSWFPDGKHIGFFTNRANDGSRINDKHGVYLKMNIETGETTSVRELTSSGWNRKISPDGKYLYYSKPYGKDGRYIVVSPLDKPDVEIPITRPVEMKHNNYSQDMNADWYQDVGK